jgi:flagellar FliL protein
MAEKDDAQATEEAGAPEKKSKLKLFIILGVALAVLGGGGFFAYTTFLAPKPAVEGAEAEATNEKPKPVIGQMFVLDPFVVNLSDPKGKRYLKIRMELELETPEALEKAGLIIPKLRDMTIMMLTSLSFEEVMTPEGKIRIRDELVDRFNQVMKPERVEHLYFTEFVIQ